MAVNRVNKIPKKLAKNVSNINDGAGSVWFLTSKESKTTYVFLVCVLHFVLLRIDSQNDQLKLF